MATADKQITFAVTAPTGSNGPAWFANLADSNWVALASTATVNAVKPSPHPGGTASTDGPMVAWCGATVDTKREEFVIPAQGGHSDYYGNEVYALAYNVPAPGWARLTAPRYSFGSGSAMDDGSPRSVHSESALCYAANVDAHFITQMPYTAPNGDSADDCYAFYRASNTWAKKKTRSSGFSQGGIVHGTAGYDSNTGKIFCVMAESGGQSVEIYDPVTNTSAALTGGGLNQGYDGTGAMASSKRIFAIIGGSAVSNDLVRYLNLDNPAAGWTTASVSGTPPGAHGRGFTWHPAGKCFYAWATGPNLFKLTPPASLPGTWVWSTVTAAGGANPGTPQAVGTYARFQCLVNVGGSGRDALIVVNHTTSPTYVYKLPP